MDAYLEKPELLALQLQQLLAVLRPVSPVQSVPVNMETRGVAASVAQGGGAK